MCILVAGFPRKRKPICRIIVFKGTGMVTALVVIGLPVLGLGLTVLYVFFMDLYVSIF
jgi:hypothetical protein